MKKLPPLNKNINNSKLDANCINFIPAYYFYTNEGFLFIKSKFIILSKSKNIFDEAYYGQSKDFYLSLCLPVISLDGINILLLNNIPEEYKNNAYKYFTYDCCDSEQDVLISFFDVNEPELLDILTDKGLKQLLSIQKIYENYEACSLIRNRIEDNKSFIDIDLKDNIQFLEKLGEKFKKLQESTTYK